MSIQQRIDELQTPNGGWTKESLAELGVPWPPPKGWKNRLLGVSTRKSDTHFMLVIPRPNSAAMSACGIHRTSYALNARYSDEPKDVRCIGCRRILTLLSKWSGSIPELLNKKEAENGSA